VINISAIGNKLLDECKVEFPLILDYYKTYSINMTLFDDEGFVKFLRLSHKFAFSIVYFISKIYNDVSEHSKIYLDLMKSESIHLIDALIFQNKRSYDLYLRSLIETLFKYIYYYDHKVEQEILLLEPSQFKSFNELFKYLKTHPKFKLADKKVNKVIDVLNSKYYEYSKGVHASLPENMNIVNNIISIKDPFTNIEYEFNSYNLIIQNIIFILAYFHLDDFITFNFDESKLLRSFLTKEQKRLLK
jgi:hypothetical protein